MQTHDYTWKCGLCFSSNITMQTNKPVTENTLILDLYDGKQYRIRAIYAAKPSDKEWSSMPDTILHAWPEGALTEDELIKLRARAAYTPNEFCGPLADVVFFPTV
jgi:hypothetical protein